MNFPVEVLPARNRRLELIRDTIRTTRTMLLDVKKSHPGDWELQNAADFVIEEGLRGGVNCRSCGAEIEWAETPNGKRIPIDKEPVEDGNILLSMRWKKPPLAIVQTSEAIETLRDQASKYKRCWGKTGFFGVSVYPKNRNAFRAQIYVDQKAVSLGYFETAKQAALAFDDAAEQYGHLHRNFEAKKAAA